MGLATLNQKGKYNSYMNSSHMLEDMQQTALLTRSEIEWLLGKRQLSKPYERKMRAVLNKKLRTWEQLERPLLEAHGFLAATISSSSATTGSSGIGHYPGCCTVRSSIADARVAPNEMKLKSKESEEYEKRMLRPGFEPGISDLKGHYLLSCPT
jgi:hypothetical protein